MNTIDELIEKLNALRARATPLPWSWEQCGDKCDAPVVGVSWRDDDETCHPVAGRIQDFDEQGNKVSYYRETIASEWASGGDGSPSANAAFVVEAVNSLPTLIAALTSLQERNRKLEEVHDLIARAVEFSGSVLVFYNHHLGPVDQQQFFALRDDMRQWLIDCADRALSGGGE